MIDLYKIPYCGLYCGTCNLDPFCNRQKINGLDQYNPGIFN